MWPFFFSCFVNHLAWPHFGPKNQICHFFIFSLDKRNSRYASLMLSTPLDTTNILAEILWPTLNFLLICYSFVAYLNFLLICCLILMPIWLLCFHKSGKSNYPPATHLLLLAIHGFGQSTIWQV